MDYLRLEGLKVGARYQSRLITLRRKEIKRVLRQCMAYGGIQHWDDVVDMHLDESTYLPEWYRGLYLKAGIPRARSIARDLSQAKAADDSRFWEAELMRYAEQRAGNNIVLVQGTLRDELVRIIRGIAEQDTQISIEKLALRVYEGYKDIELWQARRIAQTETMIGLADAGEIAARSLGVRYDKQWIISGMGNTRETHEQMDGVIVDMDEPFTLPDCVMMYPHDGSLGAPAGEIINCACDVLHLPK